MARGAAAPSRKFPAAPLLALGPEPAAGRLRAGGPRDLPADRAGGVVGTDEVEQGIGAVCGEHGPVVAAACLVPAAPHVDLVRLAVMVAEVGQVDRLAHGVPPR
jgi:hypothetical protein